jgi:hypothetical protein
MFDYGRFWRRIKPESLEKLEIEYYPVYTAVWWLACGKSAVYLIQVR